MLVLAALSTDNWIQVAIAIPGALTVMGGIWKLVTKLNRVIKEVTPNGGSSLKDRVMNCDREIKLLKKVNRNQTELLFHIIDAMGLRKSYDDKKVEEHRLELIERIRQPIGDDSSLNESDESNEGDEDKTDGTSDGDPSPRNDTN